MNNIEPINDYSSKVFEELFARYQELDTDCLLVYLLDSVDESALVHLAEQFHIMGNEGWLTCKNVSEKRSLIKNSIKLHKYRGTVYSLIKVLEIMELTGKIEEWFEYDGRPYYFRVILNMTSSYTPDIERRLIELIYENKNVRSWLDKILVYLLHDFSLMFASCVITSEEIQV